MTRDEALKALERAGTAQNRKIWLKHGVRRPMYGVSYAALKTIAKKIGTDHVLAAALWKTGNHDAIILATMVADPLAATRAELAAWLRDLDNAPITDAFAAFASASPYATMLAKQWGATRGEWTGAAGWMVLTHLVSTGDKVSEADQLGYLRTIERNMQRSKNRVRYAMNGALIAIGMRGGELRKAALEAAGRIGPVDVDHGETGCKTPDAAAYIKKAAARKTKTA
jgi:3-methyladenine DNA glycosylase AlkD